MIQYANLGRIHKTRADVDQACEAWQKALKLFAQVGNKPLESRVRERIDVDCAGP